MRIAVHHPARTEPDGTEVPETVAAFRLGRIHDVPHPVTGDLIPQDEIVQAYLEAAQREHPDLEVKVEYLVNNGDGTSSWQAQPPADGEESPEGANVATHELSVEQSQSAMGGGSP